MTSNALRQAATSRPQTSVDVTAGSDPHSAARRSIADHTMRLDEAAGDAESWSEGDAHDAKTPIGIMGRSARYVRRRARRHT
jgi:hypothetical protein